MEDYQNYREILNWDSFAKEYHIESDAYIDGVDTILNLESISSYPMILFPDSFRQKMKREFVICKKDRDRDDVIGIEDFYCAANEINSSNSSYEEMNVLVEPNNPKEPKKIEPSTTHWVSYKTHRYGCMIGAVIGTLAFFSPLWLFSSVDSHVKIFCFFGFLILGIIYIITDEELKKSETKDKEIPYTKQEMDERIRKYEESYRKAFEKYLKEKANYPKLLEEYLSQKEKQEAYFKINTNVEELFVYMYHSSFAISDNYSITDDAPQRGYTEDLFFYELMKRIPKYVKVDAKMGCYYPDFVIDTGRVKIDVEIDEPYDYKTNKETHYIGGKDSNRDCFFLDSNWIVIRFAESQIQYHLHNCADFIELITKSLVDNDYDKIIKLPNQVPSRRRWTKEEARIMAINKTRSINEERVNSFRNRENKHIDEKECIALLKCDSGKISIVDNGLFKFYNSFVPFDEFCETHGSPCVRRYDSLGFTALLCKNTDGEELFIKPSEFDFALTLVDFTKTPSEIAQAIELNIDNLIIVKVERTDRENVSYYLCDRGLFDVTECGLSYSDFEYNQIEEGNKGRSFLEESKFVSTIVVCRFNAINTSILIFIDEDGEETFVYPSISKLTIIDFSLSPNEIANALVEQADNLFVIYGNREFDGSPIYNLADKFSIEENGPDIQINMQF